MNKIKQMRKKAHAVFVLIIIVALLIWVGGTFRGQTQTLDNFTATEMSAVINAAGINTDSEFDLISFCFMSFPMSNTFFVIKLKTSDVEGLCADIADISDSIEPLPSYSLYYFFFPVQRYAPNGRFTAYTDGNYVYLSTWSWKNEAISNAYWDIENGRQLPST